MSEYPKVVTVGGVDHVANDAAHEALLKVSPERTPQSIAERRAEQRNRAAAFDVNVKAEEEALADAHELAKSEAEAAAAKREGTL